MTRQKCIVGAFLSLNIFMAITALIRASGLGFRGTFDEVWLFFWHQIEACVAVCMISLTAFRSSFISSESQRAQKQAVQRPWYSSAILRKRAKRHSDKEFSHGLPEIPSATLTGMRTVIEGGGHTTVDHQKTILVSVSEKESDDKPLYKDDLQHSSVSQQVRPDIVEQSVV